MLLSLYTILVTFPLPIVFALLLNEVKNKLFKRTIQTVSYLPHFISLVVICGIIKEFTQSTGLVSSLLAMVGVPAETMLQDPPVSVPYMLLVIFGKRWAGTPSSIWRRFPALTRRCTTRPQWTALDDSAVCST